MKRRNRKEKDDVNEPINPQADVLQLQQYKLGGGTKPSGRNKRTQQGRIGKSSEHVARLLADPVHGETARRERKVTAEKYMF